jgi:hypothetical protein
MVNVSISSAPSPLANGRQRRPRSFPFADEEVALMRDFRDAKIMARALRDALQAKAVQTTYAEALELIAKAFGYENWNILSAKIAATKPAEGDESAISAGAQNGPSPPAPLYCSFCKKSQHEVRKLIAGPEVFICNECIDLCTDIVEPEEDKELFQLTRGNEDSDRTTLLERARGMERSHVALQYFRHRLAKWDCEGSAGDDVRMPPLRRHLVPRGPMDLTREELVAMQQTARRDIKRYEDALSAAATALEERGQ